MEQIGNTLTQVVSHIHVEEQKHVTKCVHDIALNKEKANHVNTSCTYDTIPKREYGLLLRKMESWNITAPKAIVKKFGVFIVKRAVAYTEATPNVRNKAGYMTYMCNQFIKNAQPVTICNKQEVVKENLTAQNPAPQSPTSHVKSKKGIFTPPNIINWQEARAFLANLRDTDLENEEVLLFANQLKKKYNFG